MTEEVLTVNLFFTTPGIAKLVERQVDENAVHPGPDDVIDTVIWSGTGIKLWRDSAEKQRRIQDSLNVVYSHSCNGVPRTVEVKAGQLLLHGGVTYRVVLPQMTDAPIFDMGWLLYLKEA